MNRNYHSLKTHTSITVQFHSFRDMCIIFCLENKLQLTIQLELYNKNSPDMSGSNIRAISLDSFKVNLDYLFLKLICHPQIGRKG